MANAIMRWAVRVFLASVVSTFLLLYYLNMDPENSSQAELINFHKERLSREIRERKLQQLQKVMFLFPVRPKDYQYNINVEKSEKTPLIRNVTDTRPAVCRTIEYNTSVLPKFSIIIPLYNEALSMLLRTVHSFLDKSPPRLLQEIILVDDHSQNKDLQEPLERYIRLLPKVKLVRTEKREGLIRARLIGAELARGPVIAFLDAHTEANVGWAEPLLEEIRNNPELVIQPHADHINPETIEYEASSGTVPRGGFSWDLRYVWMRMPEHEKKRLVSAAQPHRTPTLVGCAIMVDKNYFQKMGAFDDDMNIWGGENIELAFRIWMCGGQVLNHPCSRIAHTFKEFHYSFDGDKETIVTRNLMRIAHLWMDDYKKFFLASSYSFAYKRTYLEENSMISLEKRKVLKRRLKCKGFDWYLRNIIPEIPIPYVESDYYGEVTNDKTKGCWYVKKDKFIGITYDCFHHRLLAENLFYVNEHSLMMRHFIGDENCILFNRKNSLLFVGECPDTPESEHWKVKRKGISGGLLKVYTGTDDDRESHCVTQATNKHSPHKGQQMPIATTCDSSDESQYWSFTYRFNWNYNFDPPSS